MDGNEVKLRRQILSVAFSVLQERSRKRGQRHFRSRLFLVVGVLLAGGTAVALLYGKSLPDSAEAGLQVVWVAYVSLPILAWLWSGVEWLRDNIFTIDVYGRPRPQKWEECVLCTSSADYEFDLDRGRTALCGSHAGDLQQILTELVGR